MHVQGVKAAFKTRAGGEFLEAGVMVKLMDGHYGTPQLHPSGYVSD